MFSVNVFTEDGMLIEYLDIEAVNEQENSYVFSSVERASAIFGRYIYYKIKKDILQDLVPNGHDKKDIIDSFLRYIPFDYEEMWKKRIAEEIQQFFVAENISTFYIDGFVTFRLASLRDKLSLYLQEEYDHFVTVTEPTEGIESLSEFMKSQPSQANELLISTFEDGDIVMSEGKTCFYIEQNGEQENVVVQSVFIAPNKVKVIDNHDILRREFIEVLKQLFRQNIQFL